MEDRFGVELLDVVGSTEATHDFLANRPGRAKAGSSGEVTPAFKRKSLTTRGVRCRWAKWEPHGQGDANAPYYWNKHEQTKK